MAKPRRWICAKRVRRKRAWTIRPAFRSRTCCSDCYTTFGEGLERLLKSMHKGIKHVGKVPQQLQQHKDFLEKLSRLQKQLEKAVSDEDFEQAAVLRDEIRQTREKFDSLTPG